MHTRHGCAQDGCTPLNMASQQGHAAVVAALLAAGANKEAADEVCVCVCVFACVCMCVRVCICLCVIFEWRMFD